MLMKQLPAYILLMTFAAVAIFGVFAMGHTEHDHSGCIGAALQRASGCPVNQSALDSVIFHASAFFGFSRAVVGAIGVVFSLLILALFRALPPAAASPPKMPSLAAFSRAMENTLAPFKLKFYRWISLHESRYPSAA